jgi:transcriptional regulator with XRE-family HTH domain
MAMAPTDSDGSRDAALTHLGKTLAMLRRKADLSQTGLAERAGIGRAEISTIERGLREPRLETLLRLAGGLGQPLGRLCEGIEWEVPKRRPPTPPKETGRFVITPPPEET